jgi:Fe2+ transport system protein FeoA
MKHLKKIIKLFYWYWYERWHKAHFQKYKSFNNNGVAKLSDAVSGVYRFIAVYCDEKLAHRLLEMGFVPGEYLTVIENTGPKGRIMIEIKGSKIALNNKIADKILLRK